MRSHACLQRCLTAALLLASAASATSATVATFTGGDPGEGLDLQGNFTYAVNVGPSGPAGRIGDANFTSDNTAGVTVVAQNNIATGGWLTADYGTTDNDNRLETVMASIRWSASPATVVVRLRVESGVDYKLQLIFGEQCCPGRGFNVVLEGNTVIENLMPGVVQAGDGDFIEQRSLVGVVVVQEFRAGDEEYEIVLDGFAADAPEINDRNAILNGFTLERLTATNDTDGDGLPDDWEVKYFGNLSQSGTDDGDQDGLTNAEELSLGTVPSDADSDDDGLTDGAEVKTHRSDPNKVDTDGDRIGDVAEVNDYGTDPTKADTDGDGFSDAEEIATGTDPTRASVKPVTTAIGPVTGADPGEGLDLDGTFLYGLAVGAGDDAYVRVRDVDFVPIVESEVAGANLIAGNTIANWYSILNYGDSADDQALKWATSSIRWSNAATDIPEILLTLEGFEVGGAYKVQLVFGEQCCNRGFDVYFDGKLVADNFNPGVVQGGINNGQRTARITRYHFAGATTLELRLDGRTAPFPDRNAILNAVTVEKLSGRLDTDNDGLPDEWERMFFGDLSQTGTGDPDQDTLTNATEFADGTDPTVADSEPDGLNDAEEKAAGTSPRNADSDGDGLKDGEEVKTYRTNPLVADTDGDGLTDGIEVKVHRTDPTKKDTDGDGYDDLVEVFSKSDPLDPSSKPDKLRVQPVTGGDPGEGLDFQGNFLYALNIGSVETPKIGDAQFVGATLLDEIPGVTIDLASEIQVWTQPDIGTSENDEALKLVLQSIRHNGQGQTVTLAGLTPGRSYQLQLMFHEGCCARGFDVLVNGQLVADEFAPYVVQGGINNPGAGAAITYVFTAQTSDFLLSLSGPGVTTPAYTDRNAILNGLTLEDLGVAPTEIRITATVRSAAGFAVTFTSDSGKAYRLEYRETLPGATWQSIATATASGASTTLTDTAADRLARPTGFYRVSTP